jgi:uncharacterized membrane protein
MVLKTKTRLAPVTTDDVLIPVYRGEQRNSPGDLLRKTWRELRSPGGQRILAWLIVLAFIVVDVVIVGQHALVRYQSYHADAFDLGNLDQAVWNTLHGHPLRFTNRGLDWYGPPTRLGVHVEPILFLIAPLYLIHEGPETLLILQTVALALGGIPLLLLGLHRLPELPLVTAAFVGAYLLTPEILGEALYDFHGVALATPLLLLALWALDAKRYGWFVCAGLLAAFCKEEVALSLVPAGLFIAFWQGRLRLGLAVSLLSIIWVAVCFLVILPHYDIQTAGANNFWYRYGWLGNTPNSALHHVLTQPWMLLSPLQDPARRKYLVELLRSGGGLGIFAPVFWLSTIPDIFINVLSTHEEQYSGFFQYNAVILPYLMASAISGAGTFYHVRRRVEFKAPASVLLKDGVYRTSQLTGARRILLAVSLRWDTVLGHIPIPSRCIGPLVIVWLIVCVWWNISATSKLMRPFWIAGSYATPERAQIDTLLASVPPNASVAATDTLNPHLSDRYTLYLLPDPQSYSADYVAFDVPDALYANQHADQQMYDAMLVSGNYRVVGTAGNVVLLQRINVPPPALLTSPYLIVQTPEDGWMVVAHRAAR